MSDPNPENTVSRKVTVVPDLTDPAVYQRVTDELRRELYEDRRALQTRALLEIVSLQPLRKMFKRRSK